MRQPLIAASLALLGLSACGDDSGDYPALLPTEQMLAEPALPAHAADVARQDNLAPALQARAGALSGRAPAPATDQAALARRAQALRDRAAALARQPLDSAATACPDDAPECTATTR